MVILLDIKNMKCNLNSSRENVFVNLVYNAFLSIFFFSKLYRLYTNCMHVCIQLLHHSGWEQSHCVTIKYSCTASGIYMCFRRQMSSEEKELEGSFVKGQLSKSSSVPRMCSHTGKANVMSTGAVKYHKEKLFFCVLFIIIRTCTFCTVYEIILWGFYWLYRDMKTTNQV